MVRWFTILIASIPMTILLTAFSEPIMSFVNDDPGVVEHGVAYLDARLIGIMAVGMNFSFSRLFKRDKDDSVLLQNTHHHA